MDNNTFIFWQNILSIHQASFLKSLSINNKVILVVEKSLDDRRIKDGWAIPDFGSSEVIISPDDTTTNKLFDLKDATHIFSGIGSYSLVKKNWDIAIKKKARIGIMSEPFNWLGVKGKLRFLKYWYFKTKYKKSISFIMAIGNRGRWCYEKVGFPKEKIFDWGYFTEKLETNYISRTSNIPTFLFIGSIDYRKNVMTLVDVCLDMIDKTFRLNIIGTGPLENELKEKIKKSEKIHYFGSISNMQVTQYIENADVLILPSIFDGWGAVVNEALMCGTPVLASDYCGASVLLNGVRGKVFSVKNNNLEAVLLSFLRELPYKEEQRIEIQKWANKNISGDSATTYFIEIIDFIFANKNRPKAPWLKNK